MDSILDLIQPIPDYKPGSLGYRTDHKNESKKKKLETLCVFVSLWWKFEVQTDRGYMDSQLQQIIDKIVAYIDPVKIYLFGSRARGDSRNDSDYDITIIYDGELSKREVKLGIRRSLRSVDISMDLFVLTSDELNDFKHVACTLAREITENGKVVYG